MIYYTLMVDKCQPHLWYMFLENKIYEERQDATPHELAIKIKQVVLKAKREYLQLNHQPIEIRINIFGFSIKRLFSTHCLLEVAKKSSDGVVNNANILLIN